MTTKTKVLYMGTPDFAVPALEVLAKREDVELVGVVTQPDKEKGRGYKLLPPPVKVKAEELGVLVFQPATVKDSAFEELLKELNPDLIVVAAYGKILPPFVIHYPKFGCINIHASLLPKYRGAAPIHWCLINGEKKTGVTIMQMDEGLDTGDMLYKAEYTIEETDTTGILFDKMATLGGKALNEALDLMFEGKLVPEKQNEKETCYSPMIEKAFCRIDYTKTAKEISNFVRGLNPFPGAKTYRADGKMVKVLFAKDACEKTDLPVGTVIEGETAIKIAAGEGTVLEILTLQPEGGKAMDSKTFLLGRSFQKGELLN
ncbi:MAG: methionyl-tRNA formyltransferase [Clostridia bacterium]|nr:methionyl-tRNA formyltransferase [Clostridia bacterium]